ncbi:MAG: hypothetical protein NTX49_06835 [Chlamydiae bacterium]|nr:hypothetical protein [Chlamydiota bacterium]
MRTPRKKTISVLCFLALTLLPGCEKYYLSLTEQDINVNYLASITAATPDKRQQNPPFGEMIVMDWRIPKELLAKNPVIDLHVVYGNYTEKSFQYPIRKKMGYVTYKDLNDEFALTKGIITYSADIRLDDGTLYKSWKHQLWANLISLNDDPQTEASVPLVEEDGPYSDDSQKGEETEDEDSGDPEETTWAVPLVEEDGPYSEDSQKEETPASDDGSSSDSEDSTDTDTSE